MSGLPVFDGLEVSYGDGEERYSGAWKYGCEVEALAGWTSEGSSDETPWNRMWGSGALYQGPRTDFATWSSFVDLWSRPSNVSTLCLRTRFSSSRLVIRFLLTTKKPFIFSYAQDEMWEGTDALGPSQEHPCEE